MFREFGHVPVDRVDAQAAASTIRIGGYGHPSVQADGLLLQLQGPPGVIEGSGHVVQHLPSGTKG